MMPAAPPLRRQDETQAEYAHRCALDLMRDPRPMYMLSTPVLEQILQLTIGACHGHRDNAIVASVEQLRREVDATIRRRARLDKEAGERTPTPEKAASTPPAQGGGTRVPLPPAGPKPLPPTRIDLHFDASCPGELEPRAWTVTVNGTPVLQDESYEVCSQVSAALNHPEAWEPTEAYEIAARIREVHEKVYRTSEHCQYCGNSWQQTRMVGTPRLDAVPCPKCRRLV